MEIINQKTHPPRLIVRAVFLLMLLILPAGPLSAQDLYIGSNTSGDSTNFTSGTSTYNNTFIGNDTGASNNSVTVQNSGTLLSNSDTVYIGNSGESNTLVVTNGGTAVVGNTVILGNNAGANNNSLEVTGASSGLSVSNYIFVGYDVNSGNKVTVSQGGSLNVGQIIEVGYANNANSNQFVVTDPGSQLNVGSQIRIGEFTNSGNQFLVSNGATVTSFDSWVGIGGGSASSNNAAIVTGTNSVWNVNGAVNIGEGSWNNSVTVSNGGTINSYDVSVGLNSFTNSQGGSNNSVLITSGGVWNNTNGPYGVGLFSVGGAANNQTNSPGGGSLTIANGGILNTAHVQLAESTNDTGTVNIGLYGSNGLSGTLNTEFINFGNGTGTLNFNQSNTVILPAIINSQVNGAGHIQQLGTGTTIFTGANTNFTGGITLISAGTLQFGNGGTNGYLGSGTITDNSDLTYNLSNTITDYSTIGGTGTLTQSGSGTLILLGTNTYSGGTIITNGTVQVGNGGNSGTLGSGPVTNDTSLIYDLSTNIVEVGVISGTGSLTQAGTGTLILTGNNTYTGGTIITNGSVQVGDGGTTGTLGSGSITIGNYSFNSLIFDRSDNFTVTNEISGPGSLVKLGGDTLTLMSSNSYTGNTFVDQGTLVANGGDLYTGSTNNFGIIVGYTNTNSTFILTNGNTTTAHYLIDGYTNGANSTVIVSGSTLNLTTNLVGWKGNGSLIITNGGTVSVGTATTIGLAASSTNNTIIVNGGTFTNNGSVTVGGLGTGTLSLGNGGIVDATQIIVNTNSTLGGNGTVNATGGVFLTAGTLAPSGTNTLTINGPLSIGNNSKFVWNLFTNSDTGPGVNFTAPLTLNGVVSASTSSVFDLNFGPNVSSTNTFWEEDHKWLVASDSNSLTSLKNLVINLTGSGTNGFNLADFTFNTNSGTNFDLVYTYMTNAPTNNSNGFGWNTQAGNWTNPSSWKYGVVPGITNQAVIDNSGSATLNTSGQYVGGLVIGSNTVNNSLTVTNGGSLTVVSNVIIGYNSSSSNNTLLVTGTSSSISVGGNLDVGLQGSGSLILENGGTANAGRIVVNNNSGLSGNGNISAKNGVQINGTLEPGVNGGLNIHGNLGISSTAITQFQASSTSQFSMLNINGTASVGGTLNATSLNGFTYNYGDRFQFLNATGGISGLFNSIVMPGGFRGRFLLSDNNTEGTLLIAPQSYTQFVTGENPKSLAGALDNYASATSGDKLVVSTALDSLSPSQYEAAFTAIEPNIYQSLATMAFNAANAQNGELQQRLWGQRIDGSGFSMSGGGNNPLVVQEPEAPSDGKDFKNPVSAKDYKNPVNDILRPGMDNRWGMFVDFNGIFAQANSANMLPTYNAESGGVTTGLTYRINPVLSVGLYTGYEGTYAKYNGGSKVIDNSVRFGGFATYGQTNGAGLYADAAVGGGYNNYNVTRNIAFGTAGTPSYINRTANSSPGGGELDTMISTGYDLKRGNWTFGPFTGLQYTMFGVNSVSETGAQSLDMTSPGWNTSSMIYSLGAQAAYRWQVNRDIVIVPQISLSWQYEFLQNPYNLNPSIGGNSYSNSSAAPNRSTLYTGVGFTMVFADRWNTALFYNAAAGNPNLESQNIFWSVGFVF